MHPSITEQLSGWSKVLTEVVLPELDDPYPRDVLATVVAGMETLQRAWRGYPAYLRWDAEETAAILRRVGVNPPAPPADPLDIVALEAHHAGVRGMLELAIPAIHSDPDTDAAAVEHFRARIERFPFQQFAPKKA